MKQSKVWLVGREVGLAQAQQPVSRSPLTRKWGGPPLILDRALMLADADNDTGIGGVPDLDFSRAAVESRHDGPAPDQQLLIGLTQLPQLASTSDQKSAIGTGRA